MTADVIVAGGSVVTPHGVLVADLAVADGRIERIGPTLETNGAEVVDATGLLVLPGVIDVHTHLRRDRPARRASSSQPR